MTKQRKDRKLIIQGAVIMAFVFGVIVAYIAYKTGSFLMGLIFLTTLQIIILLAILYMIEEIMELFEIKL
ncbi:MAG: hypothetical protein R6U26_03360 [Candidatus Undinarchaeales archaeon]